MIHTTKGSRGALRWSAASAVGPRRLNEDAFFVGFPVFAVFDGHADDDGRLQAAVSSWQGTDGGELLRAVDAALAPLEDTGASAVAATVLADGVRLDWVGDCCAFRTRALGAERWTRPDRLGEEMRDRGRLAEAERYPVRGALLQVLGFPPVTVHTRTIALAPGEQLLLCSDGVWDAGAPLVWRPNASAYVTLALAAGGMDNATAVVVSRAR